MAYSSHSSSGRSYQASLSLIHFSTTTSWRLYSMKLCHSAGRSLDVNTSVPGLALVGFLGIQNIRMSAWPSLFFPSSALTPNALDTAASPPENPIIHDLTMVHSQLAVLAPKCLLMATRSNCALNAVFRTLGSSKSSASHFGSSCSVRSITITSSLSSY